MPQRKERTIDIFGDLDTHTYDILVFIFERELSGKHISFRLCIEHKGIGQGEHLLHHIKVQSRFIMRSGNQYFLSLNSLKAPVGVVIEIGEKYEHIVFFLLLFQGITKRRTHGALLLHPLDLIL